MNGEGTIKAYQIQPELTKFNQIRCLLRFLSMRTDVKPVRNETIQPPDIARFSGRFPAPHRGKLGVRTFSHLTRLCHNQTVHLCVQEVPKLALAESSRADILVNWRGLEQVLSV